MFDSIDTLFVKKDRIEDTRKIENFKKPRFIVISLYPYSEFKMGDVICPISPEKVALYTSYPLLFRALKWWEKRSVDELPDYVITQNKQMILKVIDKQITKEGMIEVEDNTGSSDFMKLDYLLPSIEKDFKMKYNKV